MELLEKEVTINDSNGCLVVRMFMYYSAVYFKPI